MLTSEIQVFAEVNRRALVGREAVVKVLVLFQVRVLALASELAVVGDEDVVLVLLSGTVQLLVCGDAMGGGDAVVLAIGEVDVLVCVKSVPVGRGEVTPSCWCPAPNLKRSPSRA